MSDSRPAAHRDPYREIEDSHELSHIAHGTTASRSC